MWPVTHIESQSVTVYTGHNLSTKCGMRLTTACSRCGAEDFKEEGQERSKAFREEQPRREKRKRGWGEWQQRQATAGRQQNRELARRQPSEREQRQATAGRQQNRELARPAAETAGRGEAPRGNTIVRREQTKHLRAKEGPSANGDEAGKRLGHSHSVHRPQFVDKMWPVTHIETQSQSQCTQATFCRQNGACDTH